MAAKLGLGKQSCRQAAKGVRTQEELIPFSLSSPKKKVIVLAGPTAVGKTRLSLLLAQKLGGEIISADSMQVYRGMDIGTAKVTLAEQALIPHHLIDIRDVSDRFNVVDFYHEAHRCCEAILARDKVPIIVGGTGFYIHAFMYGPPDGPPSVPDIRRALESEIELIGSELLYERLQGFDPEYAATITKNDSQKIVRALEIIMLTGDKVSNLSWRCRRELLTYDFSCWFLYMPREKLYPAIDRRCEKMLADGLVEEVKLLEQKGLRSNNSAAQAIGYRHILDYLQTAQTPRDLETVLQHFKQDSRRYAKRQFTWFRKESRFRWVDIEPHDFELVVDIIAKEFFL